MPTPALPNRPAAPLPPPFPPRGRADDAAQSASALALLGRRALAAALPAPAPPRQGQSLAAALVATGAISPAGLRALRLPDPADDAALCEALAARDAIAPARLADLRARHAGIARLGPDMPPADPRLIAQFGHAEAIAAGVLPGWRTPRGVIVAAEDPARAEAARTRLEARFGPVRFALATPDELRALILGAAGGRLRARAEARVAPHESCRDLGGGKGARRAAVALMLAAPVAFAAPGAVLGLVIALAAAALCAMVVLRAAALIAATRHEVRADPPLADADLPVVTLIVPLYRETDIAARLVRRLGRIDYPRARLDVILAVEACDGATHKALIRAGLPGWMRVLRVPDGRVRTKPRALNFALPFARGTIIGVLDAEDAPARDQLRRVAARFAAAPSDLGCVQGVLDYYNPRTNWIARCFTIEYAAWFRVMMPGLERLGVPLPLGGTTLYLRRAAIEAVDAWDAHNVTEDADLGIRLALHGFRTEMIATVTEEEANCRPRAWVRQRTRWIKGHIITWAVHMRDPRRLWRRLGPRGFLGYQVVFLGAQSQFLLAPVLWSFWLIALGLPHPARDLLPPAALYLMLGLVILAEGLALAIVVRAVRATRHFGLWTAIPLLHLYFPMATLAAWRAAAEALRRPFHWDKTSHGHFDAEPAAAVATPAGFEPATIRLEGECSIRLSYGADGVGCGPAPRPSQAPSAAGRVRVM